MMEHVQKQLADYALDLLPPDERIVVERHVQQCHLCQMALARERAPGLAVRRSLQAVPPLTAAQIARLTPEIPTKRALFLASWSRPAGALALLVLLVLGLFSLQTGPVTTIAATSTSTQTATVTIAGTTQPLPAGEPLVRATPPPSPTPIAQFNQVPAPAPPQS